MAYEVPTYIWELDSQLPGETDDIGEAKDHIFAIKNSLVNTFPTMGPTKENPTGAYVTYSSDQLNDIVGLFSLNTVGTPAETISANIDGLIRLTGYPQINKNMALRFDPNTGTKIEISQPQIALGGIMATPLGIERVNTFYGSGTFLLCDGSDMPACRLKSILPRFSKLPDLRNRVITQAIDDDDLWKADLLSGLFDAQTKWVLYDAITAPDGDFDILDFSSNTHNHYDFYHNHLIPISYVLSGYGGTHPTHGSDTLGAMPPDFQMPRWNTSFDNAIKKVDIHSHKVNIYSDADEGFNFPNRLVVNYFMRVN